MIASLSQFRLGFSKEFEGIKHKNFTAFQWGLSV